MKINIDELTEQTLETATRVGIAVMGDAEVVSGRGVQLNLMASLAAIIIVHRGAQSCGMDLRDLDFLMKDAEQLADCFDGRLSDMFERVSKQ